jgi:hypothetical protein
MKPPIRSLAVLAVSIGVVALLGLPAQAKGDGEHDAVEGLAVITGPGLDKPISIGGQLNVFEAGDEDDFGRLFAAGGLRPYDLTVDGWYDLEQDAATLGPRYVITYTFSDPELSGSIVQDVYPYAQGGRPWFFVRPHQFNPMFGSRPVPSAWWTAPPWTVGLLVRIGLPTAPPVIAPPRPVPASLPSPGFEPWVLGVAMTGMLALILVGLVAGRRRAVRTF